MEQPVHQILGTRRELTKQKLASYALAGFVNLVFVWILIDGLAMHFIRREPPELKAQVIAPTKPETTVSVPKPTMIVPKDTIAPPEVVIQQLQPQTAIQSRVAPAAPSAATRANGIASTHTTPPYPPNAKKSGQEGFVLLHILISAQGDVTSATVSRSSGVPELDQTAVEWVIRHWKYKPATDNGAAVASSSDAKVVFSLKNASQ